MRRVLPPAVLALEDGRCFHGVSVGAEGSVSGEVVFTTAMTGYQEILTDPSYAGQIINFTYPLIGNVGVNRVDSEAVRPRCEGLLLRRLSPVASNHRAERPLDEWLRTHGLVAAQGIDTRALTRHLRAHGSMRGVLAAGHRVAADAALVDEAAHSPPMLGRDLTAGVVSTTLQRFSGVGSAKRLEEIHGDPFTSGEGARVMVLDFGCKHGILERLAATGARVVLAPATTAPATLLALRPDGLVISNGPGDPAAVAYGIATVRELIGRLPILGICLGHQLLAHALDLDTFKLPFGHHGANHPVRELATGRVLVTSQNHGFAVRDLAGERRSSIRVTHVSLVDQTIEGLEAPELRVRSIQFHPEASPGPHDARPIIENFVHDLAGEPQVCRPVATSNAS